MQINVYKSSCTWFIHDVSANKFLLQLRDESYKPYPNMWGFPGGGKEPTETPRETSFRELKEELNYRPSRMAEVLTLYHHAHELAEHFYYIPLDVPFEELELHEGKQLGLFTIAEMRTMDLTWWSKEVLPILERFVSELKN